MTSSIQVVLGLLALVLVFLPTIILVFVAVRSIKAGFNYSTKLIAVGAIFLTFHSLDPLYSTIIALVGTPEMLAKYSIHSIYISKTFNYIGLTLIGIGILKVCKDIEKLKRVNV